MTLTACAAHGGDRLPRALRAADGAEMVLVAAGPFIMGSAEGAEDERPPHRRFLPAFYIDRCEVSNRQYARYVAETGAVPPIHWNGAQPPPGTEDLPVVNITWFEAMRYALWAGKRLPTEAEWEKAARGSDGRRFPWGNGDDPTRRNLDHEREELESVTAHRRGASPYGCLNLCGNAWEWTADWYEPYPGAKARTAAWGRKYKVMRGGGAIGFYGIPNSGRSAQRARILPYGRHDCLGFRCVRDPDPDMTRRQAQRALAEAEALLQRAAVSPQTLSHERELAEYARASRVPLRVTGTPGQMGLVRIGVPFPRGLLSDSSSLCIVSPHDEPRPTQISPLVRWEDGSVQWALATFAATAGERCLLAWRTPGLASPPTTPVAVSADTETAVLETGALRLRVSRASLWEATEAADGRLLAGPLRLRLAVRIGSQTAELRPRPADTLEVEEAGPVWAALRLRGGFVTADGVPSDFRYDLRLGAGAGVQTTEVRVWLTLWRQAPRDSEDAPLAAATAALTLGNVTDVALLGTESGGLEVPGKSPAVLHQADDLQYTIVVGAHEVARGTRAPGWIAARHGQTWSLLGVRDFWQNHPKALAVGPGELRADLWAGADPFYWEGGLAKTHELVVRFQEGDPPAPHLEPLRAVLPPSWTCGSQAAGPLLPRGPEALRLFPYWEAMRQADMREWVRGMPTGMRDWGDAYYGGPYKGKNAYANLEYDVPLNFLIEYLRTGEDWYLQAAEAQARHQADVDIDHFTGRQWKHSPQHTTTEADLGHVFLRGLLLHYLLTGERRSLEAAREIGDWLAPQMAALRGVGNERQIGWGLHALTGLYWVTREERYLQAATRAAETLVAGQSETGRFSIRWDNRISFFNGIAMAGLLDVYHLTGNEAIAEAVLRLAERTLGFYPEYACRTLNGFCWAAERTGQPRYFDVVARTWESSMEFLMPRDTVTTGTHAWRFFVTAARAGLLDALGQQGASFLPREDWRCLRLRAHRVELFIAGDGPGTQRLAVLQELGQTGRWLWCDASGAVLDQGTLTQGTPFCGMATVSTGGAAPYGRLVLTSDEPTTWQVHHHSHLRVILCDPSGATLPNLLPRAHGYVREGAEAVKIRAEAMGEGFHSITVYNSAGHPVGAVRRFVDLGDVGRYEIEVVVPASDLGSTVGIEVHNARVLAVEGALPYWTTDPGDLFNPERLAH